MLSPSVSSRSVFSILRDAVSRTTVGPPPGRLPVTAGGIAAACDCSAGASAAAAAAPTLSTPALDHVDTLVAGSRESSASVQRRLTRPSARRGRRDARECSGRDARATGGAWRSVVGRSVGMGVGA
eukprot:354921-Chlamydomonas_euryale.AAC.14